MVEDNNTLPNDVTRAKRTRRGFLATASASSVVAFAGCLGGLGGGKTGSSGTKTLRVLNSAYEPTQKAFKKLFSEFEDEHDNVKIEYNRVGFAEAPQKASQAHASGNPYDIMNLASPGNNVTAAKKGLFQPINDVISDRGGSDYWLEKAIFKLDGDNYFAPHYGSVLNLLYREDLFKEAGAPMPPFDSWNQYKKAAKMLTKSDQNQYGHPVFLGSNHFHGVWPMMLVLGNGGHLVNSNGKIVYNSKETAEALAFIKEMDQFSPKSAHNSSIPDMRPPLYKGQFAMTWYSTNLMPSDIEEYNPDLKGKVHVTHVPAKDSSHTPVARMTGTGYGLSSKTKHPKLAKELIKFVTRKENVTRLLLSQPAGKVPMVKGILEQDQLWESETLKEYEDHYRNLVGIAQDYGRIIAVNENPGTVNSITGQALSETHVVKSAQDVVLNGMDPMASANKWAKKMREDLK
ncbi:ABC transporter substrate-binding protein [Haladaptatus sp. DFWS20]|uniref:ABC transporter substrate-binding protein n=1 Tax=Haladaptatus sp. DFWS20 TaxID=3403467 RepID=UPI003EB785C4